MFDVNLNVNDLSICSLNRADIIPIKQWLETQNSNESYLNIDEFSERFIESYVSENEFFVKILKDNEFIGIIKGRIEFKNGNEVWIWTFIINNNLKKDNLESIILDNLEKYFAEEFGIYNFFTIIAEDNVDAKKFWSSNGFKLLRIAENYFKSDGKDIDMLIYKRFP